MKYVTLSLREFHGAPHAVSSTSKGKSLEARS